VLARRRRVILQRMVPATRDKRSRRSVLASDLPFVWSPLHSVSLVLAIVALAGLMYFLWSNWDSAAILAWKRGASPLLFFAALALLPAFGMPTTPFFLLAGTTFGVPVGLVGTFAALGVNLAVCYWIARSGLRPSLERILRRFSYELPDFQEGGRGTVRFALAIKFAPGLPAFAKNYVLGMAGVPFALYFGLSLLITGAYAAIFIVLGESLLAHDRSTAVAVMAALLTLAVAVWWWRQRSDRENPP